VLTKVRYSFEAEGIRITLPNKKELMLERDTITGIEKYSTEGTALHGLSLGAWMAGETHYCITCNEQLIVIRTTERDVVISPRLIESDLFSFYS
jgi:hypothetical protein